ncbi:surface protease GP63 [Trypanosoma theileri]|uniref:Leishmanolysin-like peptidase n=1 Tax=Trypanosoma theileri TaxID=67003 RepID=A0A1X0NJS3_9TRYP|nr:surface protease GP63 [Trypanosoma theileri]ORC84926.1 surface protease GP63 [Trypanosoma theileri]
MMRHSLLHVVLLLFICGTVARPAYACNYDEIKEKSGPPVVVVRELPKKGEGTWQAYTVSTSEDSNGNKGWEALRIRVSIEDLKKENYCASTGETRKDFLDGQNAPCTPNDFMMPGKEKAIKDDILPAAIKLHTDRLQVQRMKTPLQVPKFNELSVCSHFTIPSGHYAPNGVENADFVLYVAAGPSKNTNHSSWAVTCAIDDQSKRPIVGAMNIHPMHADFTRVNVRLAAHELAHALGFDYERMKERGMTRYSSSYHDNRAVIISAKVLEKARDHYSCLSIEEVELEHTAEGNITSHWNRSNMKDELMSMVSKVGHIEGIGYYTALTIAAFHDMKFYRGNFNMSEKMSWGYLGGCNFGSLTPEGTKTVLAPDGYCIEAREKSCSSDRLGVINSVASKAGESICSILVPDERFFCTSEGDIPGRDMGLFRNDSWCLDVDYFNLTIEEEKRMKHGMCAAVECTDNRVVNIKLTVDGAWHRCREDGFVTLNKTDFPMYVNGSIRCPRYDEVCTMRSDGSSRLTSQVQENTQLIIEPKWVSSTPADPNIDVPPHSSVQRGQSPQTSTVNNAQQTTSTTTSADANRQRSSTTSTAIVNNNGKPTRSSTESTTTQGSVKQEDTNKNSKKASNRRKDNSQATKVYSPLVLLVLLVSALLISF